VINGMQPQFARNATRNFSSLLDGNYPMVHTIIPAREGYYAIRDKSCYNPSRMAHVVALYQKVSTMSPDDCLQQLHGKATRGMTLSAEEQAQLAAWYAEQDQRENALLGTGSSQHLAALHAQVETALAQLLMVTQRMQELTARNGTM